MTVLESIEQANTDAGIRKLSFANIQEFQSFMDSFKFVEWPVNVVVPFTSNGTTLNDRRKAVIPLQGWVLTRITERPEDLRTKAAEEKYLQPMRVLAIKFIKNLLVSEIINPEAGAVTDTIKPEYLFLNAQVFGVSYQLNVPIIENVC